MSGTWRLDLCRRFVLDLMTQMDDDQRVPLTRQP